MRFPARSVILSVGSPALAAYTLAITSLNTRLVCRRAQRTKYECTDAVTKALVSLQQAPFHLTRDDRLLAFVSSPDTWTREIDRLSWSVTAGSSVAWVIISFAFTLVDSFLSPADHPSRGHAVGTLWLWLLCLVVCWLWVPVFTREELRSAIGHANQNQVKESDPLPDTTQHQSTDSSQLPAEDPRDGPSTSANPTPDHNSASLPLLADTHPAAAQSANDTEQWGLLTPKMDSGSLTRDELRFGPTFNYSRIILYFALVDDVFWALEKLARDKEENANPSSATAGPAEAVFPPGVLTSMFTASILALLLQCGTTAAATVIIFYTPAVGLGCRSVGYIIYGGVAILILFLTIFSTILTRISETRGRLSTTGRYTGFIAIALRRISLFLAFINATGLILLCCLQFSRFLDNCYCNASVTGRGTDSYMLTFYSAWTSRMRTARLVATGIAAGSMAIYMVFLWFASSLPAQIRYL